MTKRELEELISYIDAVSKTVGLARDRFKLFEDSKKDSQKKIPEDFEIDKRFEYLENIVNTVKSLQKIASENFNFLPTKIDLLEKANINPTEYLEKNIPLIISEFEKIQRVFIRELQFLKPQIENSEVKIYSENHRITLILKQMPDGLWHLRTESKSLVSKFKNNHGILLKCIFLAYHRDEKERRLLATDKKIFIAARRATVIELLSEELQTNLECAEGFLNSVKKSKPVQKWLSSKESPFKDFSKNERILIVDPNGFSQKKYTKIPPS